MTDTRSMAEEARSRLEAAMQRLAEGERAALGEVYHATHAKLFGIALRILGDRKDAEDAIQDVYAALWQRAKQYDPDRASPISWLAVSARNRAIDHLRRRRGTPLAFDAAEAVPDREPLADERMIATERQARIYVCLAMLDGDQGDAIRSAFLEGQTYASLAQRLDVPLGTMKSRIRRGLARLKACLERDE